ncbi:unnamed protein product [Lathyrus oleraceus]
MMLVAREHWDSGLGQQNHIQEMGCIGSKGAGKDLGRVRPNGPNPQPKLENPSAFFSTSIIPKLLSLCFKHVHLSHTLTPRRRRRSRWPTVAATSSSLRATPRKKNPKGYP